jgi:hypothetical protein
VLTSDLWWESKNILCEFHKVRVGGGSGVGTRRSNPDEMGEGRKRRGRWRGGKEGGQMWDWGEVGAQCIFPAAIVYFVMAWTEVLRREFGSC